MSNNDQDGQDGHDDQDDESRPSKRPRLDADTGSGEAEPTNDISDASGDIARFQPELGERLRKVMLCNVCLELPHPDENYQCKLGHILCEDCVTRLLAEAALKNIEANCPHCRTRISWQELTKNLVVGQTLWELPKICADCDEQMEYKCLANHLKMKCVKRRVKCKYRCLGCIWEGCQEAKSDHENNCKHLKMSGEQILNELHSIDDQEHFNILPMMQCYRELSAKRVFYDDLELLKPSILSIQLNCVIFQSATISIFEDTWRLCIKTNMDTETNHYISYGLKLVSSPRSTIHVKYFATLPMSSVRNKHLQDVQHQLNVDLFTRAGQMSDFRQLPMACPIATYRLLAMPKIKLRLWMMLH